MSVPIGRRAALLTVSAGFTASTGAWAQGSPDPVVVETTGGKLRGVSGGRGQQLQGHPVRRDHRRVQPVPAAGARRALAGRAGRARVRGLRAAAAGDRRPAQRLVWRAAADVGGLPVPQRLDAGPTGKRPVMVWLHGGAWGSCAGSAPGFDGTVLAREGDVVVVTINHRLNLFGYIMLDDPDERFAQSGNAGVLDMVAALRWVRDNAAAFGGDPGNVTIFGQSGGGAKVSALLACPAARGLFHKAIAQSCSGSLRLAPPEEAAALAHGLAQKLGLERPTAAALQAVPADRADRR